MGDVVRQIKLNILFVFENILILWLIDLFHWIHLNLFINHSPKWIEKKTKEKKNSFKQHIVWFHARTQHISPPHTPFIFNWNQINCAICNRIRETDFSFRLIEGTYSVRLDSHLKWNKYISHGYWTSIAFRHPLDVCFSLFIVEWVFVHKCVLGHVESRHIVTRM